MQGQDYACNKFVFFIHLLWKTFESFKPCQDFWCWPFHRQFQQKLSFGCDGNMYWTFHLQTSFSAYKLEVTQCVFKKKKKFDCSSCELPEHLFSFRPILAPAILLVVFVSVCILWEGIRSVYSVSTVFRCSILSVRLCVAIFHCTVQTMMVIMMKWIMFCFASYFFKDRKCISFVCGVNHGKTFLLLSTWCIHLHGRGFVLQEEGFVTMDFGEIKGSL